MSKAFLLPELGENVAAGQVVAITVPAGTRVEPGQTVIEVETDKVTIEVPAPEGGLITDWLVKVGDKVSVGQPLGNIDADGAATPAAPTATAPTMPVPAAPPVAPEPTPISAPAPAAPQPPAPPVAAVPTAPAPTGQPGGPAAPSVRRAAILRGIDLARVAGSGPNGRILMEDLDRRVAPPRPADLPPTSPRVTATTAVHPNVDLGAARREPLSPTRRTIAQRMANAWATVPHVTQFDRCDITELERQRQVYNRQYTQRAKLTVTAVLIKAISKAMALYPQFNAEIDMEKGEVIHHPTINIGVAVDSEHGLIVPVLRDVQTLSIPAIAQALTEIADKARRRALGVADVRGAGFTLSNLGGIGGTGFTPVVNAPQVAILGVARASMEPVWQNGAFVPRLMLPLALSYDHRLIDGADGARFTRFLAEALENPFLLAMDEG